jgi:Fur family ferric uptake transcriptional regulator
LAEHDYARLARLDTSCCAAARSPLADAPSLLRSPAATRAPSSRLEPGRAAGGLDPAHQPGGGKRVQRLVHRLRRERPDQRARPQRDRVHVGMTGRLGHCPEHGHGLPGVRGGRDVDCVVGEAPCLMASEAGRFMVDEAEVTFRGVCPDCQLARAG